MAMTKIETAAQKYVRAKLAVEEAKAAEEAARDGLIALLAPGEKYVTKDGEVIAHVAAYKRLTFVPELIKALVTPRIWKAIRVDAIDVDKLKGYLAAGEVTHDSIQDGVKVTEVRSSLRVTWPALKRAS